MGSIPGKCCRLLVGLVRLSRKEVRARHYIRQWQDSEEEGRNTLWDALSGRSEEEKVWYLGMALLSMLT